MTIDISNLGQKWRGLYSDSAEYKKGDVVRKDGHPQVYNGTNWSKIGVSQLNATTKGEILSPGATRSINGVSGQELVVGSGGVIQFAYKEGRHGNTVHKLARTQHRPAEGEVWNKGIGSALYSFPHQNFGFIMTDGSVRMIGRSNNGTLGTGNTNDISRAFPVTAAFPPGTAPIVDLVIGPHASTVAAIDADGQLWMWGENNYGQCGVGNTSDLSVPTLINGRGQLPANAKVTSVEFGTAPWWAYHCTMLQCDDGRIYAMGSNRYGSLGFENGSTSDTYSPTLVPISERLNIVRYYPTAQYHQSTVWITNEGHVYMCGEYNSIGRTAVDNASYSYPRLWAQSIIDPIKHFSNEESDSHARTGDQYYRHYTFTSWAGNTYRWGHTQIYSGTGPSYPSAEAWVPWLDDRHGQQAAEYYGTQGDYPTNMLRTKDGRIYGLGYGGHGAATFGNGNQSQWLELTDLGSDNKYLWHGGARYGKASLVWKNDGRIIYWGMARNGVAGMGADFSGTNTEPVKLNRKIVDFQVAGYGYDDTGYNRLYFLDEHGVAYGCGQNNYNVLGFDDDNENIYTPTTVIF